MITFEKVNYYYNTFNASGNRLWSKERVAGAVAMNKITPDEYKLITGEEYPIQ